MPLHKMKKVWDYCTYNKPFFIFILLVFGALNYLVSYYESSTRLVTAIAVLLINIFIAGYGMTIARDRINGGVRLPKILIKDILVLGLKSSFVGVLYLFIQAYIMYLIAQPLGFPPFDLEEMVMQLPKTINMLFSHNPVNTLIFIFMSAVFFYVTAFFMEIALARLADTGGIISSFNLWSIKKDIDLIGWKFYIKEYTLLVVAMVLFTLLKIPVIPVSCLNYVWGIMLDLFIFTTQFLGIGAIYYEIKKAKQDNPSE